MGQEFVTFRFELRILVLLYSQICNKMFPYINFYLLMMIEKETTLFFQCDMQLIFKKPNAIDNFP